MELSEISLESIAFPKLGQSQKIDASKTRRTLLTYDSGEFEHFILEWLKFCKYENQNIKIFGVGGTGDEGVDIRIQFLDDGEYEVVQCKRYSSELTLPEVRTIVTKILWHLNKSEQKLPRRIFISSIKGVNAKAVKLLADNEKFKDEIKNNAKTDLKSEKIKYSDADFGVFTTYLDSFDFSKIEITDIDVIIEDYYKSKYASFRFSNNKIKFDRIEPHVEKVENKKYIDELKAFLAGQKDSVIDKIINRASVDYYCALQVESTCEYLFGDTDEFEKIKNDVETNIFADLISDNEDHFSKYKILREKSISAPINDSYLDYELHMITSADKAGTLNMLINDGRVKLNEE